jgi:septal ring factor EnvC (AmiA/AmiB activator)
MTRGVKTIALAFVAFLLAASFILGGCTRYANEDQMQALEETRMAAEDAQKKLAELNQEKAALEVKLAEKKAELEKVKAEKDMIQERLK